MFLYQEIEEIKLILTSKELNHLLLEQSIHNLFQSLLSSSSSSTSSSVEMKDLLHLLIDSCLKHSNIITIFLSYLPLLEIVDPFIDIIPSIFAISSDHLIEQAVNSLIQLIQFDNRKTLKILSTLMDLPLLPHLQAHIATLAFEALQSVDEIDIPLLCRTILKNLTNDFRTSEMIQEIRKHVYLYSFLFSSFYLFFKLISSSLSTSPSLF